MEHSVLWVATYCGVGLRDIISNVTFALDFLFVATDSGMIGWTDGVGDVKLV
jgi:hypothetical protein